MDKHLPQVELIASTSQGSVSSFPFSQSPDAGLFVNASMNIVGIDINTVDVALLVLCPILATLGVLVASLVHGKHSSPDPIYKRIFNGLFSNIANLFIGLVIGIVIALFFVGAINNDITSLTRVLVLTVFLGYKAPLFWGLKPSVEKKQPQAVRTKVAAPAVALNQDALKQERLKRARLKLAKKG